MGNDKSRTSFPRKWESRRVGRREFKIRAGVVISKGDKANRCVNTQHTRRTPGPPGRRDDLKLPDLSLSPAVGGAVVLGSRVIHERAGVLVRIDSGSGHRVGVTWRRCPDSAAKASRMPRRSWWVWAARMRGTKFDPQGDDFSAWLGFEPAPRCRPRCGSDWRRRWRACRDGWRTGRRPSWLASTARSPSTGCWRGRASRCWRMAGGCGMAVAARSSSRWAAVPVAEDVDLTRLVRAAIGDDVGLRLDANRSWSLEQAVEFGRAVGDTNIEYLEEPCATRRIWQTSSMPRASPWRWMRAFWSFAGRSRWTPGGGRGGAEADPSGSAFQGLGNG